MDNDLDKPSENVRVNISINAGIRECGEKLAQLDHRGSLSNVIEYLIETEWKRRAGAEKTAEAVA